MKNLVQDCDRITYVNTTGSAIASGAVVVAGSLLAVASVDIPVGGTGAAATMGVFEVPKTAGQAFAQGEKLIYDVSASAFINSSGTPAAGDIVGAATAWEAAASAATVARVCLCCIPGTITAGG